jgi:hypothetical protein
MDKKLKTILVQQQKIEEIIFPSSSITLTPFTSKHVNHTLQLGDSRPSCSCDLR